MQESSHARAPENVSNVTVLSDHLPRPRVAEPSEPAPHHPVEQLRYLPVPVTAPRPRHRAPSRWTLEGLLKLVGYDTDPPHVQPTTSRIALATVVSLMLSVLADVVIASVTQRLFPVTRGYVHFQFHDYAQLTIAGVAIACAGWPVVTRLTSKPRWLFLRLAVPVMLVLWLPDLYVLYRGQPVPAVAALMLMHLAIAVVTYNALVRLAPVGIKIRAGLEHFLQKPDPAVGSDT